MQPINAKIAFEQYQVFDLYDKLIFSPARPKHTELPWRKNSFRSAVGVWSNKSIFLDNSWKKYWLENIIKIK